MRFMRLVKKLTFGGLGGDDEEAGLGILDGEEMGREEIEAVVLSAITTTVLQM